MRSARTKSHEAKSPLPAVLLRLPKALRDCFGEVIDRPRLVELCELLRYHACYDARPFELDPRSRWHRTLGALLANGVGLRELFVAVGELGWPRQPHSEPRDQVPTAFDEVLAFEARALVDLPAAATLVCCREPSDHTLIVTTLQAAYAAGRALAVPTIIGGEWLAFVRSAEQDRVWPADVDELIHRKLTQPQHRFSDPHLIGTVEPEHWTLERVLDRVGLVLLDVRAGDEIPAALMAGVNDTRLLAAPSEAEE